MYLIRTIIKVTEEETAVGQALVTWETVTTTATTITEAEATTTTTTETTQDTAEKTVKTNTELSSAGTAHHQITYNATVLI